MPSPAGYVTVKPVAEKVTVKAIVAADICVVPSKYLSIVTEEKHVGSYTVNTEAGAVGVFG